MQEREDTVEHWLRTEVAASYDAHKANPDRARPLDEVWKCLETRMDDIDREENGWSANSAAP